MARERESVIRNTCLDGKNLVLRKQDGNDERNKSRIAKRGLFLSAITRDESPKETSGGTPLFNRVSSSSFCPPMRPQTGCTATKNPRDSTTPLGMLPRTKLALDIFEGELDLRTRSLLFLQLRPDSCGFCRGGGVGSRANP